MAVAKWYVFARFGKIVVAKGNDATTSVAGPFDTEQEANNAKQRIVERKTASTKLRHKPIIKSNKNSK